MRIFEKIDVEKELLNIDNRYASLFINTKCPK